jgi:site-specific DNA-cytosine methylase
LNEDQKKRLVHSINHIKGKLADGKSFYTMSPLYMKNDTMPACIFKTIPACIHYKEDRLYTLREWLTSMGMPYDFEMYGDLKRVFPKIGQNVPVRTAKFIVSEAIKALTDEDVQRVHEDGAVLFDNITQTTKSLSSM